jgi:hypothetical protein
MNARNPSRIATIMLGEGVGDPDQLVPVAAGELRSPSQQPRRG